MKFILLCALLQLLQGGALSQWTYSLRENLRYIQETVQKGKEFNFTCKGDKNLTWISDKTFTVEYGREDDMYFSVVTSNVSPSKFCCHYVDAQPKPSLHKCGNGSPGHITVVTVYIRKVTAVTEVKVDGTKNALVGNNLNLPCHVQLKNNAKHPVSAEYNISTFWKNQQEKRYPAIESNCLDYDYLRGSSLIEDCDRAWYTSELTLKNVAKEDAGSYSCWIQSFNEDLDLNRSTNVRVWEPEEVAILVHNPQNVSWVTRGENASWSIDVSSVLPLDSTYTCDRLVLSDKTLNCRAYPNGDLTSITFEVWTEQVNGSSGNFLLDFKNELLKNETKLELIVSDPRWTSLAILLTAVIAAFIVGSTYSGYKIWAQKRINNEMMERLELFKKEYEKSFTTELDNIPPEDWELILLASSSPPSSSSPPPSPPEENPFVVDESHIQQQLGNGSFGEVVLAVWQNKRVAIKYIHEKSLESSFQLLVKESLIIRQLERAKSRHIIKFFGAHLCPNNAWKEFYIVMEYCELGDLKNFLSKHRRTFKECLKRRAPKQDFVPSRPDTFSLYTLLDWAHQIATGMADVIKEGCLHNDLAAKNILLAPDNTVKLADFGLAYQSGNMGDFKSVSSRLPYKLVEHEGRRYRWHDEDFSDKSDVYCFAQVLWELFNSGAKNPPHPTAEEFARERLPLCPDSVWDLITKCVKPNPKERPPFSDILVTLKDILDPDAHPQQAQEQAHHQQEEVVQVAQDHPTSSGNPPEAPNVSNTGGDLLVSVHEEYELRSPLQGAV